MELRSNIGARLTALARMVSPCETAADIGCDHGYLGAHLLASGRCARVLFTDISAPSLRKAARLIASMGLSDRAAFIVGDGANALPEPPDAAVIAGMGGVTIARIVRDGREKLGSARLIMQPNVGVPALRRALAEAGYRMVDEAVVREGGRWYVVIAAEAGAADYSETDLLIGPVLRHRSDEATRGYAAFRVRVQSKALAGARSAGETAEGEVEAELDAWRGYLAELV